MERRKNSKQRKSGDGDVGIIKSTSKGLSTVGSMIERLRLRDGEGTLPTIGPWEWGCRSG